MNDRFLCVSEGAYGFFRAGFSLNTGNIEGHKNIRLGLAHKMLSTMTSSCKSTYRRTKHRVALPFISLQKHKKGDRQGLNDRHGAAARCFLFWRSPRPHPTCPRFQFHPAFHSRPEAKSIRSDERPMPGQISACNSRIHLSAGRQKRGPRVLTDRLESPRCR